MIGDYNRYASESCHTVKDSEKRLQQFKQGALQAYAKSLELCNSGPDNGIKPYNPVKLGLALNFSVFYYEIIGNAKRACVIAKDALTSAYASIDQCSEEMY